MDQSTVIAALTTHRAELHATGATRVYVYGSRARGDHRPDSDLDLFIDYEPASVPNLFKLVDLEQRLARMFGIPVSITTRNALHPAMRSQIEKDAIRVL